MKTSPHQKIENTLNSLEGIKRAGVNPFLMTRVLEQLKAPVVNYIKPVLVKQWVISLMVVVVINIAAGWYALSLRKSPQPSGDNTYFTNQIYTY